MGDSVTFTSGSVIGTSEVMIVNDAGFSTDDVIRNINDTFINNANVSDLAAGSNAVAVGVMAIDECVSSDARSTCDSTFAECSATTAFPGFACACKEGYSDLDAANPGTSCELIATTTTTTTIASTPPVDTTADPETDAPIITTAAPSCPPGFRDNNPSNPGT